MAEKCAEYVERSGSGQRREGTRCHPSERPVTELGVKERAVKERDRAVDAEEGGGSG